MAGMFFTMLLDAKPRSGTKATEAVARYMNNPDITGGRPGAAYDSAQRAAGAMCRFGPGAAKRQLPVVSTDPKAALDFSAKLAAGSLGSERRHCQSQPG